MTRFTRTMAAALVIAGATALAGCGSSSASSTPPAPTPAPTTTPVQASAPKHVSLYLTILTGGQIGKKEWPTYVPANFTVPADTDVDVIIRDFDDGPANIPPESAKVQGTTDNSVTVISALTGNVEQQQGKTVTELPASAVAHTLTFNQNGFNLNVPIPPLATVKFTFHSPKTPGNYSYECLSACGTGANGTEGAMATDGWMRGAMTVQ